MSSGQEREDNDKTSFRYRLSLEEVDHLLTIHTTLNIQESKAQLSLHDKMMYQGLGDVMH